MKHAVCIIFDFDGTLVDTSADILQAAERTAAELDLSPVTRQVVMNSVGRGMHPFLTDVFQIKDPAQYEEVLPVFMKHYAKFSLQNTKVYGGVHELLGLLHKKGIPSGVVSNRPFIAVQQICQELGWKDFFQGILGGDSTKKAKPDAEPINKMKNLCNSQQAIVVGDGQQDMQAAKNANAVGVWASWGFSKTEPAESNFRLAVPGDLPGLLQTISPGCP